MRIARLYTVCAAAALQAHSDMCWCHGAGRLHYRAFRPVQGSRLSLLTRIGTLSGRARGWAGQCVVALARLLLSEEACEVVVEEEEEEVRTDLQA